jgi:hypothetical protein
LSATKQSARQKFKPLAFSPPHPAGNGVFIRKIRPAELMATKQTARQICRPQNNHPTGRIAGHKTIRPAELPAELLC